MKDYIESFLELIYPEKNICQICNIYDEDIYDKYICTKCLKSLALPEQPLCAKCGKSLFYNHDLYICEECIKTEKYFDIARSPFRYKNKIKDLIHDYKFNEKTYLYKLFSYLLYSYMMDNEFLDFDLMTYVPLHKKKLRNRGYNQVELISKKLSELVDIPSIDLLKRTVDTKKQSDLSLEDRKKNLKNAFELKKENFIFLIEDKSILLLDDIYTTGTTANECSKVLLENGAYSVSILTLAR